MMRLLGIRFDILSGTNFGIYNNPVLKRNVAMLTDECYDCQSYRSWIENSV